LHPRSHQCYSNIRQPALEEGTTSDDEETLPLQQTPTKTHGQRRTEILVGLNLSNKFNGEIKGFKKETEASRKIPKFPLP
jgi:hypothetical protein